jgi:GT2 family glycosyltransferase
MADVGREQDIGLVSAAVRGLCGNTNQMAVQGRSGVRFEDKMLCFMAVFIPRKTINRIGLLDERFVAYGYEDDDYSLRVRRTGMKLAIYDGCVVEHAHIPSTFRQNDVSFLVAENRRLFFEKWGFYL